MGDLAALLVAAPETDPLVALAGESPEDGDTRREEVPPHLVPEGHSLHLPPPKLPVPSPGSPVPSRSEQHLLLGSQEERGPWGCHRRRG